MTYRPDDVRDWPFLLLSDLKEFKLPPARPYCCAEERLTLISPPKRKSLSAPRNSKASWSISCSADILINRNWQKGGISSFDTSRNTETRLRSWLIVVSPRLPGVFLRFPVCKHVGRNVARSQMGIPWNPTSSIGSPQIAARRGLNHIPGFAILLGEQFVGFGVIQELLVVAVPPEFAAQLEGDIGHVRGAGGAVGGLRVGVRLMA